MGRFVIRPPRRGRRTPPGSPGGWYREQLKERVPALLAAWEPVVGVSVADWGVKKMKTKWGSCNADARRIWLNLELAKKPPACLEYSGTQLD